MENHFLNSLVAQLQQLDFRCEQEGQTVLVIIGEKKDGTPQLLEIRQYSSSSLENGRLFEFQLHFESRGGGSSNELHALIFFLNRIIDLPGFGVHDLDETVYYRYVMPAEDHSKHLLSELVPLICDLHQTYKDLIETVASGEKTFQEALSLVQPAESVLHSG